MNNISNQLKSNTPESIIEIINDQLDISDEAGERVADEGIVVRDMKGSVIPHPAISVKNTALKIATELIFKYKKLK